MQEPLSASLQELLRRWSRLGNELVKREGAAVVVIEYVEAGCGLEMEWGQIRLLRRVEVVPGEIPAGLVARHFGLHVLGAVSVVDGGDAGHEGNLISAYAEDEWILLGIALDDVADG
jgi:hypothetical protein